MHAVSNRSGNREAEHVQVNRRVEGCVRENTLEAQAEPVARASGPRTARRWRRRRAPAACSRSVAARSCGARPAPSARRHAIPAPSGCRAGEQKIGHVEAGREQRQGDEAVQMPQRLPVMAAWNRSHPVRLGLPSASGQCRGGGRTSSGRPRGPRASLRARSAGRGAARPAAACCGRQPTCKATHDPKAGRQYRLRPGRSPVLAAAAHTRRRQRGYSKTRQSGPSLPSDPDGVTPMRVTASVVDVDASEPDPSPDGTRREAQCFSGSCSI